MSKLYLGKINLKKIDKSRIFEGKDGNKWIDVTLWLSDDPDEYGNEMAIQQSTKKDESKIYLGNAKAWEARQENKPGPENKEGVFQKSDINDLPGNDKTQDGLPF